MSALVIDTPRRVALLERAGLLGKGRQERLFQIASAAALVTGADRTELNILTADDQHHVAWYPLGSHADGDVTPTDDTACQVVVATRHPLVLDDASTHPVCSTLAPVADGTIKSYLGVPVNYRNVTLGSLCAFTTGEYRHWLQGDILALQGMALLIEATFPED